MPYKPPTLPPPAYSAPEQSIFPEVEGGGANELAVKEVKQ
jgi:hypothetical protein